MKSIMIKGKAYIPVSERVNYFRNAETFKGWSIETLIIQMDQDCCIIKAVIKDQYGRIRAEGCCMENQKDGYINKTSHVENCETGAWGRALGCLGIGIDASVASYEEVDNAIKKQNNQPVDRVVF